VASAFPELLHQYFVIIIQTRMLASRLSDLVILKHFLYARLCGELWSVRLVPASAVRSVR
jgi:hypothetical protein